VEGHTDNVPIHTRQFPSNWELSTARAVNVLKYFADADRIDPRRLSAVGYGESKPLVNNDSPRNRAKNRRVEIVLIKEDFR
jgi:chemotaxis protein MotB